MAPDPRPLPPEDSSHGVVLPVDRRLIWLGVILALVLGLGFYFVGNSRFMEIDRCLDAGGAWNDVEERCRIE